MSIFHVHHNSKPVSRPLSKSFSAKVDEIMIVKGTLRNIMFEGFEYIFPVLIPLHGNSFSTKIGVSRRGLVLGVVDSTL